MKKIMLIGLLLMVALPFFSLQAQTQENHIDSFLSELINKKELNKEDISYEITGGHVSRISGTHHIYFSQSINGLEISGTESSVHIMQNGKRLQSHINFLENVKQKSISNATPSITAIDAVKKVATYFGYSPTKPFQELNKKSGVSQETTISDGGISKRDIPVRLVNFKMEDNSVVLVWDLSIESTEKMEWYSVKINAQTGELLFKNNWLLSCNFSEATHDCSAVGASDLNDTTNTSSHLNHNHSSDYHDKTSDYSVNMLTGSYQVVEFPLPSPLHGDRTIVTGAVNTVASPYGWHDTNGVVGPEYTDTRGNNVNAYEAGDNYGFRPDGGSSLTFHFPYNVVYSSGDQSESAAVTNLFYANNIFHDIIYMYGFDEASGNFQVNNYGNGGVGNDSVNAESQIGFDCNAYFGTPGDGGSPTMLMFICNYQNRDGSFDNEVMGHEYAHGISNRLTGPPSNANCLGNAEQMGEGWSDFYGSLFTMQPGDTGEEGRGIGTFLFGELYYPNGIRQYPYTTDMTINPFTYNHVKNQGGSAHGIGSIWCTMLWDMTWALIDKYGFDEDIYEGTGGNNIALALVTEGLNIQPCNPGFVDGRDAILAADEALYGGANQCLIWTAFARRGLGYSASQGSSNNANDGIAAFDLPFVSTQFADQESVCTAQGIIDDLGGGTPTGGVYSGTGVTDNGDGLTFSFDPEIAGVGVHEITYSVDNAECGGLENVTGTIEVLESIIIACPEDIEVEVNEGETYELPDFIDIGGVTIQNNCNDDEVVSTQVPAPGTQLSVGAHAVKITAVDEVGSSFECEFTVIVESELSISNENFSNSLVTLYPNPTSGLVKIVNQSNESISSVVISDVNGRIIQTFDFTNVNEEVSFSMEDYRSGLYFVKISSENAALIKRIIKN